MPDEKSPSLTIHPRLEPEIRERLDDYCRRTRRSITNAVNVLLDEALTAEQASWEYMDGRPLPAHLRPPDDGLGGEFADHGEPGATSPVTGQGEQPLPPGWRRETTRATVPTDVIGGRLGAYGKAAAREWAQQVAERDSWQDFQVGTENNRVFTVTFVRQVPADLTKGDT